MERNEFVLESKGCCLLCLKLPSASSADREIVPERDVRSQGDGGGEEEEKSFKMSSLQRVAHYLKLNRGKVFKEVAAADPAVLPLLEKLELKGLLCGECSQLTGTISDVTLEMERLQMKLDSLMRGLHDKVKESEGDLEVMEEFKDEMLSSPETMLHFRMVEELRKETLDKSSSLIGMAKPRIRLEKLKKTDIPIPVLVTRPPLVPYVIADDPSEELEENDPVISSIQIQEGSYQGGRDDDSRSASSSSSMKVSPSGTSISLQVESKMTDHDYTAAEPMSKSSVVAASASTSSLSQSLQKTLVIGSDSGGDQAPQLLPPVNQRPTQCGICHKTFKSVEYKRDHEMTVHQGVRFKCDLCPATFVFRTGMCRHRREIHKVGGARGRPAILGNLLHRRKRQFQIGSGSGLHVRPPNIDLEAVAASMKTVVEQSMSLWTSGTKPQEADEPGNRQQQQLQFRCLQCDRPFDNLTGLRRHLTRLHDTRAAERKFECEICGKKFIENQVLLQHRRSVHFGEKFSCPKCSREFTQRGIMRRHLKHACLNRNQ